MPGLTGLLSSITCSMPMNKDSEKSISFIVAGPDRRRIGTVELSADRALRFSDNFNQELKNIIEQAVDGGIETLSEIYNPQEDTRVLFKEMVSPADPRFPQVLLEELNKKGYFASRKHPEAEAEIKELLGKFPDDDPEKQDMLKRLPEMSYLEQTAIIEELKKLNL